MLTARSTALLGAAFAALFECFSQSGRVTLRGEFPLDTVRPPSVAAFEGVIDPAYTPRLPEGESAETLRREASETFSGIIWGFDYVYTPSDKARAIDERFEITPRMPDAALRVRAASVRRYDELLYADVEYTPSDNELAAMLVWQSAGTPWQGRGAARFIGSVSDKPAREARRAAFQEAVREALRAYLRQKTHNKPREVRGSFALSATPRFFVRDGQWMTAVRIYAADCVVVPYGIH